MTRPLPVAALCLLAACAPGRYVLDEESGRIHARNRWGRVTKTYEPGTREHNAVAQRFWPEQVRPPADEEDDGAPAVPGRKKRLSRLMRSLDKDQWHILLDLDMWSGYDKADLGRLEDMERMASAVKGLPFSDYLALKGRLRGPGELRARLLSGER